MHNEMLMVDNPKKCVIMFFLDAFRYDYLSSANTPFMFESASKGICCRLKTILGFDGIAATIFTGTYPEVHDVWTQYSFIPYGGLFEWIKPFSSFLSTIEKTISSELIRKLLRFPILELSLFSNGSTHYPGMHRVPYNILPHFEFSLTRKPYERNAFGIIPSLFDVLNHNNISFYVADNDMMGGDERVVRKALNIRSKPDIIYVRLMNLDEVTHTHGINSNERIECVRDTDAAVQTIVKHVENVGLDPIIILFADHGMVNVTEKIDVMGAINNTGLREGRDYIVFLDSTMARFWAEQPILLKIGSILEKLGKGRLLSKESLKRYHAPLSRRYGDLVYLVDPGIIILPNYYQGTNTVLAMHGYDPGIPNQDSIFMISGEGIETSEVDAAYLTDIMPTVLDLLDLKKPYYCQGHSILSHSFH